MRHILITGGTSGIGKGVAEFYASKGHKVVIVSQRAEGGQELARQMGDLVQFTQADVTDEEQVKQLINQQEAIDVLVNSAGIYLGNSETGLTDANPADFEQVWRVNTFGLFLMCKYALLKLKQSKGSIVNISSISGMLPEPDALAYTASKAAVNMLTKTMALAHVADGVRVNAVCPGPIETPMLENGWGGLHGNKEYETWIKNVPMKRAGTVAEVVRAVAYLADPENTYVTGNLLVVDGGWMAKSL